jgi:hypothetical protein
MNECVCVCVCARIHVFMFMFVCFMMSTLLFECFIMPRAVFVHEMCHIEGCDFCSETFFQI